jgi:hypothetical protein
MSEHLEPADVLALVALRHEDPERERARAHAETCVECSALWADGERMLSVIDRSFELPAVEPALHARVALRLYPKRWPRLVLVTSWLSSLMLVMLTTTGAGELASASGRHCALGEAAFAVFPLAAAAWLTRAGRARLDATSFAALTGVGALVGQLWLRGHCPVHDAAYHAFAFHFLVLVGASLVGGLVGRRIIAFRR